MRNALDNRFDVSRADLAIRELLAKLFHYISFLSGRNTTVGFVGLEVEDSASGYWVVHNWAPCDNSIPSYMDIKPHLTGGVK